MKDPRLTVILTNKLSLWVWQFKKKKKQKAQVFPVSSSTHSHTHLLPSSSTRSTAIYVSWFRGPRGISCWELALFVDLAIPRKCFTESGSTPFSWRLHRNTRGILTRGQPFFSITHFPPPEEGPGNYETAYTKLENYSRAELCEVMFWGNSSEIKALVVQTICH